MAFAGTVPVLDDFNRVSIGSNWAQRIITSYLDMQIASNLLAPPTDNTIPGAMWWNQASFGPDVETFATIQAKPAANVSAWQRLYARLISPGTASASGYIAELTTLAGTDQFKLHRLDNAVATQIGVTLSLESVAGWKLGIQCAGSTIGLFYNTGSSWTQGITVTDTTYTAGGFVGIGANKDAGSNVGRMDDFAAGTVAPSVYGQYVTHHVGAGAGW